MAMDGLYAEKSHGWRFGVLQITAIFSIGKGVVADQCELIRSSGSMMPSSEASVDELQFHKAIAPSYYL